MMDSNTLFMLIVVFVAGALLIWYVAKRPGNKKIVNKDIPSLAAIMDVLHRRVLFFQGLNEQSGLQFAERVQYFLATTKITAEKGTELMEEDRILIATSATIPLFHFAYWSYENLDEVIVYPGAFDEKYTLAD